MNEVAKVLKEIKEARKKGKGFYFKVVIDHEEEFTISQADVRLLAKSLPIK